MGQVIPFPAKIAQEESLPVWQCHCGNQAFILAIDGEAHCSECFCPQENITFTVDENGN